MGNTQTTPKCRIQREFIGLQARRRFEGIAAYGEHLQRRLMANKTRPLGAIQNFQFLRYADLQGNAIASSACLELETLDGSEPGILEWLGYAQARAEVQRSNAAARVPTHCAPGPRP